jgi:hypothetical protein
MQVGETVEIVEGGFNIKGCIGVVQEVVGSTVTVKISETRNAVVNMSQLQVVNELELLMRQGLRYGK